MSKPSKRSRQIADLIHTEIAVLLKREVSDPRLNQVSITSVRLSPDLGNADIYFTLHDVGTLKEVMKAFGHANGYLRRILADRIELRYTPKLNFIFDKSLEQGAKISELIEHALLEDGRLKKLRKEDDSND